MNSILHICNNKLFTEIGLITRSMKPFEGIAEFLHVATTGNFSQAAKELKCSTAQISRTINKLEKHLNCKLFYRTTRTVTLTNEGEIFFKKSYSLLNSLDDAKQALLSLQNGIQGKVKLSAPITYGEQAILPLLNNLLLNYPELALEVNLSNSKINLIEENTDLAIRIGPLVDSTMMATKIANRQIFFAASPSYLKKNSPIKHFDDLNQHQCLSHVASSWLYREPQNKTNKVLKISGRVKYNSGLALVDAAIKGLGVIQLPDYYIQPYLKSGKLVTILEDYQPLKEDIWAIYPNNRYLSPKISLIINYLKENLNSAHASD